jgi:hypothetical protein
MKSLSCTSKNVSLDLIQIRMRCSIFSSKISEKILSKLV